MEDLKRSVLVANLALAASGLAPLTFGNASGIDRAKGLVVIKPSGVPYSDLTADNLAVVDLEGRHLEGGRPSTDLFTHLALYRAWPHVGGVAHTHSDCAVAFAQALKSIPCLGTTHADHFRGPVPVTRPLTAREVGDEYETVTGAVIIEALLGRNPLHTPAALVASHGPFTWGRDPAAAVQNSVLLEMVARMALMTLQLDPAAAPAPAHLQDKHYARKHGKGAYYGQGGEG
jgi:L-ribulose-5-phosphate 4-epimerase